MVIYKITNLINNKIYVGQTTKTIEERLQKHWQEAKCEVNGTRPNNYFHNALLKYGIENFVIEELDTASSIEELNEKEYYWIETLNARDKEIGYNLMADGKSGIKGQETRDKISAKKKANWEDEELAQRMRAGLAKATQTWAEHCKENRIEIQCEYCKKRFSVPPYEAKTRRYCSLECASKINIVKATETAAEINRNRAAERHKQFKSKAIEWAKNHKELINRCHTTNIPVVLKELVVIAQKYGFKDWRIISKSICGSPSKINLLNYLKEI